MRWLLLVLATGLPGLAQDAPHASDVAALLAGATSEVLLAAPQLRSFELAEALREALVVRGVAVYLLLPDAGADERASYARSLELAGAALRRSDGVAEGFLVIDRTTLLVGSAIGALDGTVSAPLTLRRDPTSVAVAIAWFYHAFNGGVVRPLEALLGGDHGP